MTDFFTALPVETAAPVPDGPLVCGATDAMRRIHRVFLWAYAEAPGLARSASARDTVRSGSVVDVLRNFDKLPHVHHEGEDLLLYPKRRERSPACALHVDQMFAHHAQVAAMFDELAPIRDEWASAAEGRSVRRWWALRTAERGAEGAPAPGGDRGHPGGGSPVHKEVQAMAKHGSDAFEIKVMLGYLGMVFATNPPGERDAFATDLSLYVRLGYKVVGRDRTVLTPTPPLHVVGRGRVGRNRNRPRTRIGGRH